MKKGPEAAGLLSYLSYAWVRPFIDLAWQRPLEESDAHSLVPDSQDAFQLHDEFMRVWKELEGTKSFWSFIQNRTTETILSIWWRTMAAQLVFCAMETACRIAAPVLLYYLLQYLLNPSLQPQYIGWLYAIGIGLTAFCMLIHHVLYFLGFRMGILQVIFQAYAYHTHDSLSHLSPHLAAPSDVRHSQQAPSAQLCLRVSHIGWTDRQPCLQ